MQAKKALGIWMLTALVIGNMVGSGVFLLPSSLAQIGSVSIIAWVISCVGAICIALVFARLANSFPKLGGPYAYCRDGFSPFMGFQVAYNHWIYIWTGNAAIAVSFTGYLSYFFPQINHNHLLSFAIPAALIWLITLLNIRGIKGAGLFQLFAVILKTVPLVVIAIIGIFYIHPQHFQAFNVSHHSTIVALTSAITLTFWAFTGVESATVPAEDVVNPSKTIPRATIIGTLVSSALYIFCTIAIMAVLPMADIAKSSAPFAYAAKVMFGPVGADIIAVVAMISAAGAVNGWIMLQGQIPYAAAKDKLAHPSLAKKSHAGTPYVALILSSMLTTILLVFISSDSLVSKFSFIILLATMAILLVYFFTAMAELLLMARKPQYFSVKEVSKQVTLSSCAAIYIVWAIIGSGERIVFLGTLLFLSGIPLYVWVRWHYRHTPHFADEESHLAS